MSNYTFNVIWKFPFKLTDYQEIKAPTAFKPIHVGLDPKDDPCIWALVDSTKNKRGYAVWVVGTGNPLPQGNGFELADHIGTIVMGPFVWHVFVRAIFEEGHDAIAHSFELYRQDFDAIEKPAVSPTEDR